MGKRTERRSHLGLALILFVVGTAGALLTGITALLVWLSEWLGFAGAALVICVLFSLVALLSYLLTIRDTLRRATARLETVSDVAILIQEGYDWVVRKASLLLRIAEDRLNRTG